MKEIEEISDKIECKIKKAEEYAQCALTKKESDASLAETYYKIANGQLEDMNLLHAQVVSKINAYKQQKGQTPQSMKILYDILHHKHIEHAAAVKGMLALYKEI